jgi:RNA polymerase sigma factor (sigma-70 family)
MELSDHLFRRESGRMVATLTRILGVHNLDLAEDVVQDAFCRALEVWKFRGVPENPSAWLMATAKNRALDVLRRERTARTFAPELGRLLHSEWTLAPAVAELFAANAIKDDQLRMMFSCCHPRLPEEAQVALILNILCGFSVDEVASAFVSGHGAIEKRITRAKKVLAGSKRLFDLAAPADFSARLPAVQRALYLLFNEGYHGASPESAVRSFVRKRCAWRRCFASTRSPRRRRRMRFPRSCAFTARACRPALIRREICKHSSIKTARNGMRISQPKGRGCSNSRRPAQR